jgi:aminomethyltransferase
LSAATAARTPLYEWHVRAGARMVAFAGFEMPVLYRGIVEEHRRVRATAGVFDVSHMGEFSVSGPGALDLLERVTTNRVAALTEGRVQYSAMCYENGGFVDDLLVYRLPGRYMLVVNASNKDKDLEWIRSHASGDVAIEDASSATALIAVQGPASEALLAGITDADLAGMPYYHSASALVAGRGALVSRTGYTGEDGFEIYCDPDDALPIWEAVFEAGAAHDVEPVGLGARDTLRLEMGYCLYGNDIDAERTPVEAGLMWITKLDKGDFVGRDAIVRTKAAPPPVRLVAFELEERGVPRHGQGAAAAGRAIGVVTSGTFSPSLEKGIGMGYLEAGSPPEFEIDIRGRMVPARAVKLPFYKGGSVRRAR